jgi:hypothetical protein
VVHHWEGPSSILYPTVTLFLSASIPSIVLIMSMWILRYRVIINDCPIAFGVENPHKFGMCR